MSRAADRRTSEAPRRGVRSKNVSSSQSGYLTRACAFFLSAQYRFMRSDTVLRAAADMRDVRFVAFFSERRRARRFLGRASSGNARSMAMISARRRLRATSAPVRARSRSLAGVILFVKRAPRIQRLRLYHSRFRVGPERETEEANVNLERTPPPPPTSLFPANPARPAA